MAEKKIIVEFNSSWVLEKKKDGILPGEALVKWGEEQKLSLTTRGFTKVEIIAPENGEMDASDLKKAVLSLLKEQYPADKEKISDFVNITAEDYTPEKKEAQKTRDKAEEEAEQAKEETVPEKEETKNTAETEDPVGMQELKSLCDEITKLAPVLKKRHAEQVLANQTYLFSIDQGEGLTTALNFLQQCLIKNGLSDVSGNPAELDCEKENSKGQSVVPDIMGSGGKTVCLDISCFVNSKDDILFRDVLRAVNQRIGKGVFVFRIPFLQERAIREVERKIADVLRVRTVRFTPFTTDQLREIAEKRLEKYGFSADEDVWEIFEQRLTEEKNDGRFYGLKTLENVVDDMLLEKARSVMTGMPDDDRMRREELKDLVREQDAVQSTSQEDFEGLYGMQAVKDKIREMADQLSFTKNTDGIERPAMHMRFVGSPGTGKTTVARITGKLFKEKRLLSKGYFFEHEGGDFMGEYVGQTAPKVRRMCMDAYGSVMFIDEAYSLIGHGSPTYGRSYHDEALDTLVAQMENHKDDFVVIMAGYPKEIEALIAKNPGMDSRVPHVINFENYSRDELCEIFMMMVQKSVFRLSDETEKDVRKYFSELKDEVMEDQSFANARYVRNLFEKTWGKTVSRMVNGGGGIDKVIRPEDFSKAIMTEKDELNRKNRLENGSGIKLGFAID